ncbi:class III lanthionine synthetase LanKC [Streptomyces sp. NPDC059740]|uniref:class III lanthionine synthetase LanKC n=1 Tax=Streptomyces sp. NPDC059740 TaxID=3346926 RepID=UPI003656C3D0
MDQRYEVYCLADRRFYERPDRHRADGPGTPSPDAPVAGGLFEAVSRPVPEGWRAQLGPDWYQLRPAAGPKREGAVAALPAQGWKVHVSACLDNAEKVAGQVWDHCVAAGTAFKFVPGPRALHLKNSKYADRGASGKFATLYPVDEEALHTVLRELGAQLAGEPGPYILSDLRWREGPLYVRYGGFSPRYCVDERGALVPALADPGGTLVPDPRQPAFRPPSWAPLPDFLRPELEARDAVTMTEVPYRVDAALHFSNGGGVYAGTDLRSGAKVVLKEARPHAGLAADGADAVARLGRERAALERLSGLGAAPEYRDWFVLGEHRFLVMDHVPGRTLNSFFADRHPLMRTRPPTAAERAGYARWALHLYTAVEEKVAAVHGRGLVVNDLHLFNIMVAPDERDVTLLDFEAAADVSEGVRQALAHPGFVAPADRRGFAVDHYALACLRLAVFLPMTSLLALDRAKAGHLAEVAAEEFPEVPAAFWREAVDTIVAGHPLAPAAVAPSALPPAAAHAATVPDPPHPDRAAPPAVPGGGPRASARRPADRYLPLDLTDWPRARDAMTAAVLASATPDRADRLFPGDIAQFGEGGGLGVAHGAAGVLLALAEVGAARHPEGEEWLLRRTEAPPHGTPLGLYDGLTGVALVLDRLGHRERAAELLSRVLAENWRRLTPDLHGGLAGLALTLDHLGRTHGEAGLRAHALEAAAIAADRLAAGLPRAGLMKGATGLALMFLRLHESTGDTTLLDLAGQALHADLGRCVTDRDGTLLVVEGRRSLPYLGGGSAGLGMVIDDYLAHRADPALEAARTALLPACTALYYAQPGLLRGRAGTLLHLARTTAPGGPRSHAAHPSGSGDGAAPPASALRTQVRALGRHALLVDGHLVFPGEQLLRLSMDLATGTSGVLLALGAALAEAPAHPPQLPFLPPPPLSPAR